MVGAFCLWTGRRPKRARLRKNRKDDHRAKELEAVTRMREGDVGGLEVLVRRSRCAL